MKITKRQLRRIIKEEKAKLLELGPKPDMDAPGWGPNDSDNWAMNAESEIRQEDEARKSTFLATQQALWEDHFDAHDPADPADVDDDAQVIEDFLSNAYDAIQNRLEW